MRWQALLRRYCVVALISFVWLHPATAAALSLNANKLASFTHPWDMVFLPNNEILVSERGGTLWRLQPDVDEPQQVPGLPLTATRGQGGLMGLALHPQFAQQPWLYWAYVGEDSNGYHTQVARGQYRDGALSQVEIIFKAEPKRRGGRHFGGRLLFDRQGYLYIGLGDRGQRQLAQDLSDHTGSVIRLHADGRVPADNPFVNTDGARPEIYSYGHRNIQGMALNPANGQVWVHEHGPRGGDEINIVKAGANYGWPLVTFGEEYSGGPVGDGATSAPGLSDPLYYWTPSIAPSGMTFYSGERYQGWRGNLIVGALKYQLLARLSFAANGTIKEERLLEGELGRIRAVQQGPDGWLYVLTDESNGGLYRLTVRP